MPYQYHEKTVTFSNEGTRNEVRQRVIDMMMQEEAGTGNKDDASRYIYFVETLSSGDRVYLQRPANLHNGFDFLVCVENANYARQGEKARNNPKHEDFFSDLQQKKASDPAMYAQFYELLRLVFECHDVDEQSIRSIHFDIGLPADHILKAAKWLFIEQDIRYWNYSGRYMTWAEMVPEP